MITKSELLNHWQGHRSLTKKTIEKFPESELFTFSVGGMRPFAMLVKEMLALADPGLESIVTGETASFNMYPELTTKEDLLKEWDEVTPKINNYFNGIGEDRMHEKFKMFGQYEMPILYQILYFLDNEIHHRAQGFVYLRALGIEPPAFWDRY